MADSGEKRSDGRRRVLDPVERTSEVVFGLIMALSFTGSIEVATGGSDEIRPILVGAIGCNVAWGLVDAVMYLVGGWVERGRNARVVRALAAATAADGARAALKQSLPEGLVEALSDPELDRLRAEARRRERETRPGAALGAADFVGAAGVFFLVLVATFPVVVPFLLVSDVGVAKRVSNGVALVMLFASGYVFAKEGNGRPVVAGLASVAIGVILVLVTLALGG